METTASSLRPPEPQKGRILPGETRTVRGTTEHSAWGVKLTSCIESSVQGQAAKPLSLHLKKQRCPIHQDSTLNARKGDAGLILKQEADDASIHIPTRQCSHPKPLVGTLAYSRLLLWDLALGLSRKCLESVRYTGPPEHLSGSYARQDLLRPHTSERRDSIFSICFAFAGAT